jgi:asparagine synthase (glutamine-hydrolysing)
MSSILNTSFQLRGPTPKFEEYSADGIALGHLSSPAIKMPQTVWNEDHTRLVFLAGNIFDYESRRTELTRRGHDFKYPESDAEFILHGFEEWGDKVLDYLNGVFTFVLYDTLKQTVTLANDRYGIKPMYFHWSEPSLTFASEVKAILQDDTIPREVNWEGWRDFFSYGFLLGVKTLFKNINALGPGSKLNLSSRRLTVKNYWQYTSVKVDHGRQESALVTEGARLIRQAIERRSARLQRCIVLLSGGYDSRCIASAIRKFTRVEFETFTSWSGMLPFWPPLWSARCRVEPYLARLVAKRLGVRNSCVPQPDNPWQVYFVQKIFLVDGMSHEHLWGLPLAAGLPGDTVNFDGLAGDVLLKGSPGFFEEPNLMLVHDQRKLASILYRQLRGSIPLPVETLASFFPIEIRQILEPTKESIVEELGKIGDHENIVTIFHLTNRSRRTISLLPNNIIGTIAPCIFPFLDNDLVRFGLTIPPSLKLHKEIYFKILTALFPDLMKIPTNHLRFRSQAGQCEKRFLLNAALQYIKYFCIHKISQRRLQRDAIKHLMHLLDSLEVPTFVDVEKLRCTTREYLQKNRDPSPFFLPMMEFLVWYDLFYLTGGSARTKLTQLDG